MAYKDPKKKTLWSKKNGYKEQKKWREANPEKTLSASLKYRFGISLEDYNAMLEAQEGLCGICRKPCVTGQRLAVDHCHTTDRIRGLLCGKCNRGLGHFDDDPLKLEAALKYLKELQ